MRILLEKLLINDIKLSNIDKMLYICRRIFLMETNLVLAGRLSDGLNINNLKIFYG
jgi:hypothetical protein